MSLNPSCMMDCAIFLNLILRLCLAVSEPFVQQAATHIVIDHSFNHNPLIDHGQMWPLLVIIIDREGLSPNCKSLIDLDSVFELGIFGSSIVVLLL